jgi:RNA polymerase sigma factor (sigma-70 family)
VAAVNFDEAYPLALRVAKARAWAAVRKHAVPAADAEDLAQEGLIAVWRALPSFDPSRGCLKTFVENVVQNRLTSIIRAAAKVPQHEPLNPDALFERSSAIPAIEMKIDVERVTAAFRQEERDLIEQLKEHCPAEAGREMEIPRSTAYRRIMRIRPRFAAAGLQPHTKDTSDSSNAQQ